MSEKHTPEPWRVWDHGGDAVIEVLIPGTTDVYGDISTSLSPENVRRIVACVNACADVSDEDLADDCVKKMKADRDNLLAQRDSLLPALRALYGWIKAEVEHFGATAPDDFIIEMVEKALSSCDGKIENA